MNIVSRHPFSPTTQNQHGVKYCNNCGNSDHILYQCTLPIVSIGTIVFRIRPDDEKEYLMIRRKDTLGYVDFIRGKYATDNREYILRMFNQMTVDEKARILDGNFEQLWRDLWGKSKGVGQYRTEEKVSHQKFNVLSQNSSIGELIGESNLSGNVWTEQEWGFPKGRRNYQENDYTCALREMHEETGYSIDKLRNIHNVVPYEEVFKGSNDKVYKHKYYLMYMDYASSVPLPEFQRDEVSGMEWFSYDECLNRIRSYNTEKKKIIIGIHGILSAFRLVKI